MTDFTAMGQLMGRFWLSRRILSLLFSYHNDRIKSVVAGIAFDNPVGLAVGFST